MDIRNLARLSHAAEVAGRVEFKGFVDAAALSADRRACRRRIPCSVGALGPHRGRQGGQRHVPLIPAHRPTEPSGGPIRDRPRTRRDGFAVRNYAHEFVDHVPHLLFADVFRPLRGLLPNLIAAPPVSSRRLRARSRSSSRRARCHKEVWQSGQGNTWSRTGEGLHAEVRPLAAGEDLHRLVAMPLVGHHPGVRVPPSSRAAPSAPTRIARTHRAARPFPRR